MPKWTIEIKFDTNAKNTESDEAQARRIRKRIEDMFASKTISSKMREATISLRREYDHGRIRA